MSAAAWPGPDATRAEVQAFRTAQIEAHNAKVAAHEAPWGFVEVDGQLRAHEAPPMAGGPSPVCNACGAVRIQLSAAFCRTCLEGIALATGGAP